MAETVDCRGRVDTPELPRTKKIPWVRKRGNQPDRAGLCIDLSVRKNNLSLMRVLRPVGQFQLKFKCLGAGLRTISGTFLRPPAENACTPAR